jgi:single-strand DNA-binding protein
MNNLRNKVQLIGNLGADPEIKTFDSGKKKVRLSLATSENYKSATGEKVEQTHWHNLMIRDKAIRYRLTMEIFFLGRNH